MDDRVVVQEGHPLAQLPRDARLLLRSWSQPLLSDQLVQRALAQLHAQHHRVDRVHPAPVLDHVAAPRPGLVRELQQQLLLPARAVLGHVRLVHDLHRKLPPLRVPAPVHPRAHAALAQDRARAGVPCQLPLPQHAAHVYSG